MTKEDAISKAADWWTEMTFSGHWNNGDAKTEAANAYLKAQLPGPCPPEASLLRKAFLDVLNFKDDVYNDYGNSAIDTAFIAHKLKYMSSIHCPQKAGTRIFEENGEWFVEAKSGYGQQYIRI